MKTVGKITIFLTLITYGVSKNNYFNGNKSINYRSIARKLLVDWCSLTCGVDQKKHIACEQEGKCVPASPCKLEKVDKSKIIEEHNKLRNKFASGEDNYASGIYAANMVALEWDDDLAFTASCNLVKCEGMEHDHCHITPKFDTSGQNLWSFSTTQPDFDCSMQAIGGVQNWYDEISLTSVDQIKSSARAYQFTSGTGHFTQVVWAKTSHVGCAVTKKEEEGTHCLMACNYGPAGNVLGMSMFIEGSPCSHCPSDLKCGAVLKGLCGTSTKLKPDFALVLVLLLFADVCCNFVK